MLTDSSKPSTDEVQVHWIYFVFGVFWITVCVLVVILHPFRIPSGSMKPALLIGDYLVVNEFAYGMTVCPEALCDGGVKVLRHPPKRGDVVVFKHPVRDDVNVIKRVIGLPGDTVQMVGGRLFLNGRPADSEQSGAFVETFERQGPFGIFPSCENRPTPIGGDCVKTRSIESLPGGPSYPVLSSNQNGRVDNTPLFTVPDDHIFVMGDNRDNSRDSRYATSRRGVGFVPMENLIGKAKMIIFSSAGRSMDDVASWRPDRYFKWVR